MDKEIEVFDFFNEFLDNNETKKIIQDLVLWFNNNINVNYVRKYYKSNYVAHGQDPLSNYIINENSEYWNLHKVDLKKYILQKLNIFSKDEYYEVFQFFKSIVLKHSEPIKKENIDKFTHYDYSNYEISKSIIIKNYNFVKKMYIVSLNNMLKKYYDMIIDKSKENNNFLIEENYNILIQDKIKNILIQKLIPPKINIKSYPKKERNMYEHEKKEYFDKLFQNTNQHYYKIFNFSFINIDVDDYELYTELFNTIINEYNACNIINNNDDNDNNIGLKKIKVTKLKNKNKEIKNNDGDNNNNNNNDNIDVKKITKVKNKKEIEDKKILSKDNKQKKNLYHHY